ETALGSLSVHDCSTEGTLYPQIVREAVGNMFEGLRAQTRAVLEMKLDDIKLLIKIQSKANSKYSEADYKRLESLMYDCFSVQLSSTQLLVGQSVDRCLAQICNSELKYGLNVIDRINLQFLVGMSILPRAPNHTKFRVSGHLPLLKTNFSDRKKNNDSIIETVTSSSPKEESPKMDSTEKLSFAKVANDLLKENKNVKGKGESSDEEAPEEHNEEFYDAQDTELSNAKMNQRMFEFEFRVDKFTTTFKQADSNPDKPDVVLVDMVLEHIGLTYVLRPFDMSAEVVLKSLSVVDKISDAVDKKSPEYMSKFEGISQSVDIEMSTKIIVTHTFTTPAAPSSPQSSVETESPILPESQKPQPSQTSTMLVKVILNSIRKLFSWQDRILMNHYGNYLHYKGKFWLFLAMKLMMNKHGYPGYDSSVSLSTGSAKLTYSRNQFVFCSILECFPMLKLMIWLSQILVNSAFNKFKLQDGNNSYLTRITAGLQKIRLTSNFTIPKTTALQIHQIINDIDINFNISYAEQVEGS
ncbi:16413_t:CDS:10, partial [Gigaspora rosea]